MARFLWIEAIRENFGTTTRFTAEDLAKKTGHGVTKVRKALWNIVVRSKKAIHYSNDTYQLKEEEEEKSSQRKKMRQPELLKVISQKFGDETFSATEMATTTGCENATARRRVRDLHTSGYIRRVTYGRYALTQKGHNKVASCYGTDVEEIARRAITEPQTCLLLRSLEETWDENDIATWAANVIIGLSEEEWVGLTETLVPALGKVILKHPMCRDILEKKAREILKKMMSP